jgi:hypothetical protein
MNMILHNNPTALIAQRNTLADPKFKDGDTLKTFDYVVAIPPFSVKLRQHGVDLGRIAVYMGHTSMKVTERYYANVPVLETAREDMEILNKVIPLKSGKQSQVASQNPLEKSQVAKAK